MKYYRVQYWSDETGPYEKVFSEQEILDEYWSYWVSQMAKKFGPYHPLITPERCIEDFVVVHWACEVKIDEKFY